MIDKRKAQRLYKKSIQILKEVQLKNGGCLATPPGKRYPYIYPRDHSIIILGFISAGLFKEARKALDFLFKAQLESGAFPQRIDTKGRDASYKPIQIDGTALALYAFTEYVSKAEDKRFADKWWQNAKGAVNYIISNINDEKQLVFTPNSVHEFPPTEEGLEIWANSTCYAALIGMDNLGGKLSHDHPEWKSAAVGIRTNVDKYLWNNRLSSFIKNIRIKDSSSVLCDIDASSYSVSDFGVFDDNEEKVRKTIRKIEKELWNKNLGGICRYPKYEGRNNGGWGPWPHFTLMICRHFIRVKNKKKADKYLRWVIDISDNLLLPEHLSTVEEFEEYVSDFTDAGILRKDRMILIENARKHPMFKKGIAYITMPLTWPHSEFIRTWNLYQEVFY